MRRGRLASQRSKQPLFCGKALLDLGGLGPLLFKETPITVDPGPQLLLMPRDNACEIIFQRLSSS
jgi:hypothetical protein